MSVLALRANRPDVETGFDQLKSKAVSGFRASGYNRLALCQLLMHLLSAEMATGSTALKQGEHTLALGGQATAILMESLLQGLIVMHRR